METQRKLKRLANFAREHGIHARIDEEHERIAIFTPYVSVRDGQTGELVEFASDMKTLRTLLGY